MGGADEVVGVLRHVGGVTRAHQLLRGLCGSVPGKDCSATFTVGRPASAGAFIEFFHGRVIAGIALG